jgi:hypothetical protein
MRTVRGCHLRPRTASRPLGDTLPAMDRERAVGAVLGAAVADALGAPFEFGPPGAFTARFPEPGTGGEMCGGGPGTRARPPTTHRWPS